MNPNLLGRSFDQMIVRQMSPALAVIAHQTLHTFDGVNQH